MREQFANNATTTLDSAIDGSQTTIDVVDGSVFPSTGNFRLIVDSEYMLCTARNTNTLTVVRGIEGSTPVAHLAGATISQILTVGSIQALVRDVVPHPNATPFRMVAADGTPLTLADFTKTDGNNATAPSEVNGIFSIEKTSTAASPDITTLGRSLLAPPYTLTAAVRTFGVATGSGSLLGAGIGIIDSGTGRLVALAVNACNDDRHALHVTKYSSLTNQNAQYIGSSTSPGFFTPCDWTWLRIEDDSINFKFHISPDGYHWTQVFQVSRTDYLTTPDTMCFLVNNQNNVTYKAIGQMAAWIEEN